MQRHSCELFVGRQLVVPYFCYLFVWRPDRQAQKQTNTMGHGDFVLFDLFVCVLLLSVFTFWNNQGLSQNEGCWDRSTHYGTFLFTWLLHALCRIIACYLEVARGGALYPMLPIHAQLDKQVSDPYAVLRFSNEIFRKLVSGTNASYSKNYYCAYAPSRKCCGVHARRRPIAMAAVGA